MIRNLCGVNETDNSDEICDDGTFSMISNDDISPSPLFLAGLLLYVFNMIHHS
jgi:hypothetical protein